MLKNKKLFWQFFGAHIIILFLAVGFVSLYTGYEGRKIFKEQWIAELEMHAELAAAMFQVAGSRFIGNEDCRKFFMRLSALDRQRFTLILPDGSVVGDTKAEPLAMESHGMRPEVREARTTGSGRRERYSSTLGRQMLYVARRVPADMRQPEQAILRVSVPMTTLYQKISASNQQTFVMVVVVLLTTLGLSYLAALRIVGPVSDLQSGLTRIENGEYSFRLKLPPVPHLSDLVRSINQTADSLERHIRELEEERNLRALILKNMELGVIAVDSDQRIMNANQSALDLLNAHARNIDGGYIGEVIRYPKLLKFLDLSRESQTKMEAEMCVELEAESGDERVLTMQANALKDPQGNRIGTLIILTDITRIRKLETVRQDFVDNVSHELRTPITSIKGFSETLLDGAMEDPETCRHFIGIIARQSEQLEQIVHDLLELSRLDQSVNKELECCETPVREMLENAVELCQNRVMDLKAFVKIDCQKELFVNAHAGLIEQALVNLIDNALKYGCGENSKAVEVTARREGVTVKIEVRDFGAGIERSHLSRIFERFYRVDGGRSRELGGSGLGLAIVKHIVMIHHGIVEVASEHGCGSTFTMILPDGNQPESAGT
ncbi:MAG: ATP-binding protein [Bacteroidales bacterium]|nr:ATP-binding protein [Bacteroidales bacterium]